MPYECRTFEKIVTEIVHDGHCDKCGKEMTHEIAGSDASSEQFHHALVIQLYGGYGMYFDNIDHNHDTRFILCRDCVDDIRTREPWMFG